MVSPKPGRSQQGYALMVVLLAFCLLVLMLAKAVPSWRTEIQREHEAQMIDRARQYRMAIKRYYHKNGRYPPDLDALVHRDGFGLRYLRQKWRDPLNRKGGGAWQFIHFGQAVTAEIVDQPPQQAQTAASAIGAPGLAGGLTPGPGGIAGLPSAMPAGGANLGMTPIGGQPGNGAFGGASSGAASAGPIIGVASMSKKPAVHAFNGFDTPDHWQFVYNFATDPTLQGGAPGVGGLPGTVAPGATAPGAGGAPGPTPIGQPAGGGPTPPIGTQPPGGCCGN
jgi:type II secretory pathway pseudopilin PulG